MNHQSSAAMKPRQRFWAIMTDQPFDRLPIVEWATWWDLTLKRWRNEGLPDTVVTGDDLRDFFGLDHYLQWWVSPRETTCPPITEEKPLIHSRDDYQTLRQHLYPNPTKQDAWLKRWTRWAKRQQRDEAVLWITLEGFFWFPRVLLGVENHLTAFYDQPDLLHIICQDLAHWHLQVIETIGNIAAPDFMTFAEDLSYNLGPMISEELFDTFLAPYYRQVIPALEQQGTRPFVDTDGDITLAIPWFERAGIHGFLPLERQAGVDLADLQTQHSTTCFIGHFDKLTMSQGEPAMRQEFERLVPCINHGRYLLSCDHQTPPEVSLENYQIYLSLFREFSTRHHPNANLQPIDR